VQRFQRVVPALSISSHFEAAAEPRVIGNADMCLAVSSRRVPGVLDDAAVGS
jgi:hypothetical protein